jgi:hypothetical protein
MEDPKANLTLFIKKTMFKKPWGYAEGFIIAFGLLIFGFIIEIISKGKGITLVQMPWNVVILLIFINLIFLVWFYFKENYIIKWLSTIPAAVGAMSLIIFLVLVMGFFPQEKTGPGIIMFIGFNHIATSYPFLFAQIFFFISLGFVILRRSIPLTKKNLGFLLNHLGLWITLAAAGMGAGDLKRLYINLEAGQDFTNLAYDANKQTYKLNIALKLTKFNMEEHPAKLLLVETSTGKVIVQEGKQMIEVYKSNRRQLEDWVVTIDDYKDYAVYRNDKYVEGNETGATTAAAVTAYNKKMNKTLKGWICSGSFAVPLKVLDLDNRYSLAMSQREAKKYSSRIEYLMKDGSRDSVTIEVNRPVEVGGWKLYQSGYDSNLGRWSRTTIIELINDDWLPFVYIGLFFLICGASYLFWTGRREKITN